jgi:hypothetical protein
MRAGTLIIAVSGLGLIASIACSRNANQANFIGAACQTQADCPAELLCVHNGCYEPCQVGGQCPNPGEVCTSEGSGSACVPAGSGGSTDKDGSGPIDPGTSSSGGTSGASSGNPAGPQSDGTDFITGISMKSTEMQGLAFAMDGSAHAVFLYNKDMGISGNVPQFVVSAPGAYAEQQIATVPQPKEFFAVAGGNIVYTRGNGGGQNVYTRPLNLSAAETQIGGVTMNVAGGAQNFYVQDGNDIVFMDGSNNIRILNVATGALDATIYGSITMGGAWGKNGNSLMWVAEETTNAKVYSATVGNVGTVANVTFGKNLGYSFVQPVGTTTLFAQTSGALYEVPIPDGPASAVSSFPTQVGNGARVFGSAVYYARDATGMGVQHLFKFDLTTKTETDSGKRIGSVPSAGGSSIYVTASGIYALEALNTGGGTQTTMSLRVAQFPSF